MNATDGVRKIYYNLPGGKTYMLCDTEAPTRNPFTVLIVEDVPALYWPFIYKLVQAGFCGKAITAPFSEDTIALIQTGRADFGAQRTSVTVKHPEMLFVIQDLLNEDPEQTFAGQSGQMEIDGLKFAQRVVFHLRDHLVVATRQSLERLAAFDDITSHNGRIISLPGKLLDEGMPAETEQELMKVLQGMRRKFSRNRLEISGNKFFVNFSNGVDLFEYSGWQDVFTGIKQLHWTLHFRAVDLDALAVFSDPTRQKAASKRLPYKDDEAEEDSGQARHNDRQEIPVNEMFKEAGNHLALKDSLTKRITAYQALRLFLRAKDISEIAPVASQLAFLQQQLSEDSSFTRRLNDFKLQKPGKTGNWADLAPTNKIRLVARRLQNLHPLIAKELVFLDCLHFGDSMKALADEYHKCTTLSAAQLEQKLVEAEITIGTAAGNYRNEKAAGSFENPSMPPFVEVLSEQIRDLAEARHGEIAHYKAAARLVAEASRHPQENVKQHLPSPLPSRIRKNMQRQVEEQLGAACPAMCDHFFEKARGKSRIEVSGELGKAFYHSNLEWEVTPSPDRLLERLPANEFSEKAKQFLEQHSAAG